MSTLLCLPGSNNRRKIREVLFADDLCMGAMRINVITALHKNDATVNEHALTLLLPFPHFSVLDFPC